ncbi:hypothetical protein K474DRAFT_1668625 [Panus rudis PR-1116 ss-1]|nr:hypothetical protein K474DRAFT_1668625 [Panus rudis PR-1116 ss-1]
MASVTEQLLSDSNVAPHPPGTTIQHLLQSLNLHDDLPEQPLHPYCSAAEPAIAALRNLIETTNTITPNLNAYLQMPLSDSKLLSNFRQYTTIASKVHISNQILHHTVTELRTRKGIEYGEDIPFDRTAMVDWCVSRVESWASSAGMETFKEEERNGRMTVVLGGKVLVVDIDFSVDRSDPQSPVFGVSGVKTSYAVPNGAASSTTEGSASLDGLLADSLRNFLKEVQKDEESQDPMEAARLGRQFSEHLKYLMKSDQLASREGDHGLHWFNGIDDLAAKILEPLATEEATNLASTLSVTQTPLDIFLMRAHALPLPYLSSPCISFLLHLSPLAYLSLLRAPSKLPAIPPNVKLPALDIPISQIRSYVASYPRPDGVAVATLALIPSKALSFPPDPMSMGTLQSRPMFPLAPARADLNHTFVEASEPADSPAFGSIYRWYLDFTDGGKTRGIIMSQSKMREIENVINPFSSVDDTISTVPVIPLGIGSWVDLLLNVDSSASNGRYTALYKSATGAHPPCWIRFTAPDEPGFILERVPVQTIKEVLAILEIVREQCWLNESIKGCQWVPEGIAQPGESEDMVDDEDVGENDLQAVLSGHITPRRIPVNVHISAEMDMFGDHPLTSLRRSKIVLSSPERYPITGSVTISVNYDADKPRGVAVSVVGGIGADLQVDVLEEICRRGGLFGLPGRMWIKAQGPT